MSNPLTHLVTTQDAVTELYGEPSDAVQSKTIDHFDDHCRAFIARSPFVLVATVGADGTCDVSPRGGPAGFCEVLDERTLVLADAAGNKRLDTVRNIVATGRVGLLFLIPGIRETLRVNGRASITRDPGLLERHATNGKLPTAVIGVEIEEGFLHCAKAFIRSQLWQHEAWPSTKGLASAAQIWKDHIVLPEWTTESVQEMLDDDYVNNLY